MSSFGDGDDGDGDHRPQYLCHQCNRHFSLFPPPPSSDDILCPNCNSDSFQQLPTIPVNLIQTSGSPFSNMPPDIAASFAADGGVTTFNITLGPGTVIVNDRLAAVTNPVSATLQHPASELTNGNFQQLFNQFLLNSLMFPGGAPPPPSASEIGGNENSDSESETIDEDDLD